MVLSLFRFVGMAFKAVYFYGHIGVTTATEMVLLAADMGNSVIFIGSIVTLDTFFKTVFWGADAFTQRIVTLMEYVLHVISTHFVR